MTPATLPLEALLRPHIPADQGHFVSSFAAPDGIGFEEARYDNFRRARSAVMELYFWTQSRCLVTTASLARRNEFDQAALGEWPVVTRRSGGGTVFHGPDVLCISLLERQPGANIERAYLRICSLIVGGLCSLGLAAEIGAMPSAPCDGRFNLLLGGRKIAGTAARLSPGANGVSVLAHASLVVGGNVHAGVAAVERFERGLGLERSYAPGCMTSLSEHLGAIDVATVAAAIRTAYST